MKSEDEQIDILIGRTRPGFPFGDTVPSYLSDSYTREGTSLTLATSSPSSVFVTAALLRAAHLDEEEDVRVTCMEGVAKRDRILAAHLCRSMCFDSAPSIRSAALDILVQLAPEEGREMARQLAADPDESVAAADRGVIA